MSLDEDTIKKLQATVDLDRQDLKLLNDKATIKLDKIRSSFAQHENEVNHVKKDLSEKQQSLNFMKEQASAK